MTRPRRGTHHIHEEVKVSESFAGHQQGHVASPGFPAAKSQVKVTQSLPRRSHLPQSPLPVDCGKDFGTRLRRHLPPKPKGASSNTALEEENNALKEQVSKFRGHFGSSHFLFERALCFSCVTSFSGFVLSKFLQPSFVVSHLFSWRVLTMGLKCLSLLNLVHLRIMVPVLASTAWLPLI